MEEIILPQFPPPGGGKDARSHDHEHLWHFKRRKYITWREEVLKITVLHLFCSLLKG
jgi:hypothetical protein